MKSPVLELCTAAKAGDIETMRKALATGADINAPPGKNRNPALLVAAESGQADAIEFLLEQGAAADLQSSKDGSNALQKAMGKNRVAAVAALLKHKYYQEQATGGNLTSMLTFTTGTAIFRMLSDLQHALRKIAPETNCPDWTALHEAASTANSHWVRELLERGLANPTCRDGRGRTPLHCIRPTRRPYRLHGSWPAWVLGTDATQNAIWTAGCLIAYGGDIEARDCMGVTPAILDDPKYFAGIKEDVRRLCAGDFPYVGMKHLVPASLQLFIAEVYQPPKFTYRRGSPRPAASPNPDLIALEQAAAAGDAARLKEILPQICAIDLSLSAKRTALMIASETGHAEAIRTLIAAGAKVDHVVQWNRTALHLAAAKGQAASIQALLAPGADIEARDSAGYTPLMALAMHSNCSGAASALIAGGATLMRGSCRLKLQVGRRSLVVVQQSGTVDGALCISL